LVSHNERSRSFLPVFIRKAPRAGGSLLAAVVFPGQEQRAILVILKDCLQQQQRAAGSTFSVPAVAKSARTALKRTSPVSGVRVMAVKNSNSGSRRASLRIVQRQAIHAQDVDSQHHRKVIGEARRIAYTCSLLPRPSPWLS
jgi:hypothetical protein